MPRNHSGTCGASRVSLIPILFLSAVAIFSVSAAPDTNPNPTLQLYAQRCSVCHGADAGGTDRGPALTGNRRLRARPVAEIASAIKNGTPGGMPAFPLPEDQLSPLADYVHSLNATAFEAKPQGDQAAGERFFFGAGKCDSCHTVGGRGGSNGPDLSSVARQMTLPELEQSLTDPSARIAAGYAVVDVTLANGQTLRGFARSRGTHDLQLQTPDGRMHFLTDKDYTKIATEEASMMPAVKASPDDQRNLVSWLSRLGGVAEGPITNPVAAPAPSEFEALLHPAPGEWPTYYGTLNGNRYSALDQINKGNAARLQLQWIYPIQYQPLETTPLVAGGMMFVTGPNQVSALDARSGREIWRYSRPRTPAGTIAGDAALGANRGVALLGDRVFFNTDNAHMLCLNRLTGALLWDVNMTEAPQHYGTTTAPPRRQRSGDLRSGWRRRRHSRFCRRMEGDHRRTGMALLDRAQARRTWLRDVAGRRCHPAGRRFHLARPGHTIPRQASSTGPQAIRFPIPTAHTAWATTSIRIATSRSIRRPAKCAGTSNTRRTICTIGMPSSRLSSSTRGIRAAIASCCCTAIAMDFSTFSTAPTASFSSPRRW